MTLAIIDNINAQHEGLPTDKHEAVIKSVNSYLSSLSAVHEFSGSDNVLIEMDKSWGQLCASLRSVGIQQPNRLSLFDFWSQIEYLKKNGKSNKSKRDI